MPSAQTILITGVSSGIGLASAQYFAQQGWNVIATARNPAAATELMALPNVLLTRLDVQESASIAAAVAEGLARFGQIDVLLNNAGYGLFGIFESTPQEQVLAQFQVNVFGVMDVTRAVLPHFRQQKHGQIINVSSGAGFFTLPLLSLYCASKFALEGFTEALAFEMAAINVKVKLIEPHGGVSSTRFSDRSGAEAQQAAEIADYAHFVDTTQALSGKMRGAKMMPASDVAAAIYAAATDNSDQLRYLVGDDKRGLVAARRGETEAGYMRYLHQHFMPG